MISVDLTLYSDTPLARFFKHSEDVSVEKKNKEDVSLQSDLRLFRRNCGAVSKLQNKSRKSVCNASLHEDKCINFRSLWTTFN